MQNKSCGLKTNKSDVIKSRGRQDQKKSSNAGAKMED